MIWHSRTRRIVESPSTRRINSFTHTIDPSHRACQWSLYAAARRCFAHPSRYSPSSRRRPAAPRPSPSIAEVNEANALRRDHSPPPHTAANKQRPRRRKNQNHMTRRRTTSHPQRPLRREPTRMRFHPFWTTPWTSTRAHPPPPTRAHHTFTPAMPR